MYINQFNKHWEEWYFYNIPFKRKYFDILGLIVKSVWLIKQEYNKFNFSIKSKSMMTSKLTF